MVRVLERTPTAEHNPTAAHFLVTGQCLIPEIEQVVVKWNNLLDILDVLHQSNEVIGEELHRRHRADTARIER